MSVQSEIQRIRSASLTLFSAMENDGMSSDYWPGLPVGQYGNARIDNAVRRYVRSLKFPVAFSVCRGYVGTAIPDYLDDYDEFVFTDNLTFDWLLGLAEEEELWPGIPPTFNVDQPNWGGCVYGVIQDADYEVKIGENYYITGYLLWDGEQLVNPATSPGLGGVSSQALFPCDSSSVIRTKESEGLYSMLQQKATVLLINEGDGTLY